MVSQENVNTTVVLGEAPTTFLSVRTLYEPASVKKIATEKSREGFIVDNFLICSEARVEVTFSV